MGHHQTKHSDTVPANDLHPDSSPHTVTQSQTHSHHDNQHLTNHDTTTPTTKTPQTTTPPQPFHVYAKNARINKPSKIAELLGELELVNWDIVLLSEARARSGISFLEGGHKLFTCLKDRISAGVGLLVHKQHVEHIVAHNLLSDRVLSVDIRSRHGIIRYIAVYMPHAGYSDEELQ